MASKYEIRSLGASMSAGALVTRMKRTSRCLVKLCTSIIHGALQSIPRLSCCNGHALASRLYCSVDLRFHFHIRLYATALKNAERAPGPKSKRKNPAKSSGNPNRIAEDPPGYRWNNPQTPSK